MAQSISAISQIPIDYYIIYSTVLFTIGVLGVLIRRNTIIVLMSIELMLNAVNLLITSFSTYSGDSSGQIFVFFIMVVAAAEASVGLAILVMIYRKVKTIDISFLDKLKG